MLLEFPLERQAGFQRQSGPSPDGPLDVTDGLRGLAGNAKTFSEFLNRGEFRSIPTVIFYTDSGDYLCHWIERPVIGYQEGDQFVEEARKELPEGTEEAEVRKLARPRLTERYPAWQKATVEEIRSMLSATLGL